MLLRKILFVFETTLVLLSLGELSVAWAQSPFPKPQLVPGGAALTPPRNPYAGSVPAPQLQLSSNSTLTLPRGLPPFVQPSQPPTGTNRSVFDKMPKLPVVPTVDRTPSGTRVFGGRFGAAPPEPNPYWTVPPLPR